MITFAIAVFASLFSVVNPLGAVPVYLAMTPDETPSERAKIARNTSFYFILILLAFFAGGTIILNFFGISLDAMRIAGGLVIFTSGYTLMNGKFAKGRSVDNKVKQEAIEKDDISFSPMAMPLLSGPGSISLLISLYVENNSWDLRAIIIGMIVLLGFVVYGILRVAPQLLKLLGVAGLRAISRIMGFLVMAIGVQYIIVGITSLVSSLVDA